MVVVPGTPELNRCRHGHGRVQMHGNDPKVLGLRLARGSESSNQKARSHGGHLVGATERLLNAPILLGKSVPDTLTSSIDIQGSFDLKCRRSASLAKRAWKPPCLRCRPFGFASSSDRSRSQ